MKKFIISHSPDSIQQRFNKIWELTCDTAVIKIYDTLAGTMAVKYITVTIPFTHDKQETGLQFMLKSAIAKKNLDSSVSTAFIYGDRCPNYKQQTCASFNYQQVVFSAIFSSELSWSACVKNENDKAEITRADFRYDKSHRWRDASYYEVKNTSGQLIANYTTITTLALGTEIHFNFEKKTGTIKVLKNGSVILNQEVSF